MIPPNVQAWINQYSGSIMHNCMGMIGHIWGKVKTFSWLALVKASFGFVVFLLTYLIFGSFISKLWLMALRVWLVYFTFTFWAEWLLYEVAPVLKSVIAMLPNPAVGTLQPIFEFINASSTFIPWAAVGTIVQWLIVLKVFFLSYHLVEYVWERIRRFIVFLTA